MDTKKQKNDKAIKQAERRAIAAILQQLCNERAKRDNKDDTPHEPQPIQELRIAAAILSRDGWLLL